jgi:hypothetical protein
LGRGISPADCGEQRQSRLACPADCPHNPFGVANYSQLLEIETRLDAKSLERLLALAPDPAAMQKKSATAKGEGLHAANTFFIWHLFLPRTRPKTLSPGAGNNPVGLDLRMMNRFSCAPRSRYALR